jgi:hypothetical protein
MAGNLSMSQMTVHTDDITGVETCQCPILHVETPVQTIFEFIKWQSLLSIQVGIRKDYAMNITKKRKKNMSTANILIMSQRLDVMFWKYLTISL